MMLHGAGGSAEFAADETGWSELADRERFAVVYPEGFAVRPERPPKFLTNPQEWNDGSGRGRHDDVGFLLAVLDDLAPLIDPRPRLRDRVLERGRDGVPLRRRSTRIASPPSPRWPATAGSATRAVAAGPDLLPDRRFGPARAACRRDRADALGQEWTIARRWTTLCTLGEGDRPPARVGRCSRSG